MGLLGTGSDGSNVHQEEVPIMNLVLLGQTASVAARRVPTVVATPSDA